MTSEHVLANMVEKTKDLPEYEIYQGIPECSDKTVVTLIAELGDLHRSATSTKLNAFVGIHSRFNDSGEYKSSGFITKGGNTIVRKVLFKAISNIDSRANYGHQNHIDDWYQKKKQSSMSKGTKKSAIGDMSRLLRTMHYLGQLYDYDTESKR